MKARSRRTLALSLLSLLAVAAVALGAASCATSGQGENQVFVDASSDGSPTSDGTTSDSAGGSQDSGVGSRCDADTMTDPSSCGACGNHCPSGDSCSCGVCTPPCKGGLSPCCGQCVDVTRDPGNCGTCGNSCMAPSGGSVPGTPLCQAGACSFTCPLDAGLEGGGPVERCGADAGASGCYDLTSSAGACGACGRACSAGDVCVDSVCCPSGDGICGGTCTSLDTPTNCGACGAACPAPAMCTSGKCTGYITSTPNPVPAFIDACHLPGHATVLVNTSQWQPSTPFALPFTFQFFGTAESQAWIGSEGTLGFGAAPNDIGYPDCTAGFNPFTGYPAVVVFGDSSLVTGPGGVCYGETGGADAGDAGGASQFVVTWEQTTDPSDPGSVLTFSLVLTQGTNTLDFQYGTMTGGADAGLDPTVAGKGATVGLQLGGGGPNTALPCATAFITATPYDVRFSPP